LGEVLDLVTLLSAEQLPIRQIRAGIARRASTAVTRAGASETVIYIFANLRHQEHGDEAKSRDPLFYLMGLRTEFEGICRRWFDVAQRLERVRAVVFSTVRTEGPFLDQRLFAYAQALEAFHRVTASSRGKVHYIDRLRRLFKSLEHETAQMITTDVERFCRATVDTRNLVTHLDQHRNSRPFPKELWHVACGKLETLIFVLLLRECGIPEARIRTRMERVPHFRGQGYDFNAPIPDDEW
jgi:hypothetical protein